MEVFNVVIDILGTIALVTGIALGLLMLVKYAFRNADTSTSIPVPDELPDMPGHEPIEKIDTEE